MSASNADRMWNTLAGAIKDAAKDSLGVASESTRTHSTHRESWWFNEEVQSKIAAKQSRFKDLLSCREGNQEDMALAKERYKVAKREAKIAVAREKDNAYEDLYKKLDSKEGANDIYKIAKARERRVDLGNVRPEGSGEVMCSSPHMHYDCYYSKINQGEVRAALQKMGRYKAVGRDQIPIEAWRCLEDEGVKWLTCLFNKIFSSAKMPEEWRLSEVILIYKNNGDAQACSNYRGIKLLSHTMKLWERVIERSVPRELVWRTLIDKGTPRRYLRVIRDMYEGAKTYVRTTVGNTKFFPVEVGLHQGSAISPYLFTLILDELSRGIQKNIPWCMIFADNIVLIAESAEGLNNILESRRKALEENGLRVSREKTKYLRCEFGRYEVIHQEVDIRIGDRILQPKESFKYLGSLIHRSGRIDEDVAHRIRAGWVKWRATSGVLCDRRNPLKLKGEFYKVAIRPAMLYGSECWPITKAQANRVEVAELRMLRWTCGRTMVDMIPNGVFRAVLAVDSIIDKMREGRLRWFGHVKRRPQTAPVRRVEALLVDGVRRRGRPKLRWEDRLKMDMKELLLSEDMTSDRNAWRDRIRISGSLCLIASPSVLFCAYLGRFACLVFVSFACLLVPCSRSLSLSLSSLMRTYTGLRSSASSLFTSGFISETNYVVCSECWPITKTQAMEVMELRMLRWTCGRTMVDMIPNGVFRVVLEVDSIIDKMREGRLRWFGHVKRRPQTTPVRRVKALLVNEAMRRGRPKLRWEDRLKMDMKELLLSEDMTFDRNTLRDRIRIIRRFSCLVFVYFVCLPVPCSRSLSLFMSSLMHMYTGRRSSGSSLFTFGFISETKRDNEGIGIGIIVPLEEGAPMGTSLLTNHFNSTGAAMPRGTTLKEPCLQGSRRGSCRGYGFCEEMRMLLSKLIFTFLCELRLSTLRVDQLSHQFLEADNGSSPLAYSILDNRCTSGMIHPSSGQTRPELPRVHHQVPNQLEITLVGLVECPTSPREKLQKGLEQLVRLQVASPSTCLQPSLWKRIQLKRDKSEQNRIKTRQKQEAWRSLEKSRAVSVDRARKTEEKRMTRVDDWEFKGLFGVLLVDNVEEQRWVFEMRRGKERMSVMSYSDATFLMDMFPFEHCPEGNGDVSSVCFVRERKKEIKKKTNEDESDGLDNVKTDWLEYELRLRIYVALLEHCECS
nr:hypothetical protein [Tanacetum cinerariifolium]